MQSMTESFPWTCARQIAQPYQHVFHQEGVRLLERALVLAMHEATSKNVQAAQQNADAYCFPSPLLITLVGIAISKHKGEDGFQEAWAVALLQARLMPPVVPGVPVPEDV